jgi:hypothetical protein
MRKVVMMGLAAATMAMAACGGGNIGEPEGSANVAPQDTVVDFLLEENSSTVLRGRLATADGVLSFFATSHESTTIVRVQINGKTFDVTLDGTVTIDGHDAVLSVADKALLQTLVGELTSRFATAPSSRVEAVATLGSYLSEAPVGYAHRRLVDGVPIAEGLAAAGNGSVVCYTKGATKTAVYDNRAGATISKSVVLGSNWGRNAAGTGGDYSCMGLCGGGCFGSKYTKDCLNHDTCSHDLNASGGSRDTHGCADEYAAASDDMFGGCTSRQ